MGGVYEQDDVDAVSGMLTGVAESEGTFFPLPEENDFQNAFAAHEGARKAIAVNSCGTGLDCCMMALDVGPGDEVITTPLTFVCTAGTAIARGARVVLADIDPVSLNLDPRTVREKITERTRAIIPVHFAGLACDVDAFDQISGETGVPVIYDAAHAVGTRFRGEPVGGRGKASCYSFQSNKNMTCLGEGGAVTTDDEDFAEQVRQLKTFGYVYGGNGTRVVRVGFNYRMTKPQYAVGLTQLAKIDRVIQDRRERMVRLTLDGPSQCAAGRRRRGHSTRRTRPRPRKPSARDPAGYRCRGVQHGRVRRSPEGSISGGDRKALPAAVDMGRPSGAWVQRRRLSGRGQGLRTGRQYAGVPGHDRGRPGIYRVGNQADDFGSGIVTETVFTAISRQLSAVSQKR